MFSFDFLGATAPYEDGDFDGNVLRFVEAIEADFFGLTDLGPTEEEIYGQE